MTEDEKKRIQALRDKVAASQNSEASQRDFLLQGRRTFISSVERLFGDLKSVAEQVGLRCTQSGDAQMQDSQLRERFRVPGAIAIHHPNGKRLALEVDEDFAPLIGGGFGGLMLKIHGEKPRMIAYDDKQDRMVFPRDKPVVALELVEEFLGARGGI